VPPFLRLNQIKHPTAVPIEPLKRPTLTNGFSKKLIHHAAAVSLYVTHYNLYHVHEALRTTPGVALGVADRCGLLAICWTQRCSLRRKSRRTF